MADEQNTKPDEGATAAPAKPQPKPRASRKAKPKKNPPQQMPPWKVLLHNDDVNDVGFVVLTIMELTPIKQEAAVVHTAEAHKTGVSLLLVTHKERAELYQEQFESKGLTVTIEPAEKD